jgi:transposase
MLKEQLEIKFSAFSELYDMLIPADDTLRLINDRIDFSFVYDELKDKYCPDNGRNAISPITMFKYLFLKVHSGLSDKDLVKRVKTDLSFKYFLGMVPEELPIDSSSLSVFRRQRLLDENMLDKLIEKTVSLALDKGIVKRKTDVVIDATHTVSRYNAHHPNEALKALSKRLRMHLYKLDESQAGKLAKDHEIREVAEELAYCRALLKEVDEKYEGFKNLEEFGKAYNDLEEAVGDVEARFTVSRTEKDAKMGSKGKGKDFFGFKSHLAATPEGFFVGATVTTGECGDGPQAAPVLDKVKANGLEVESLIGDGAYSSKDILAKAADEDFKVVAKLHPSIFSGYRRSEPGMEFGFNKDADMPICPAGHLAVRKREIHYTKGKNAGNSCIQYNFDIKMCHACPLKSRCLKHENVKSKSISVPIHTEEQKLQKEYQQSDEFKEKYKKRYIIEQKNAHLKQHGLGKTESYGIEAMTLQTAMAVFYQNVKYLMKNWK